MLFSISKKRGLLLASALFIFCIHVSFAQQDSAAIPPMERTMPSSEPKGPSFWDRVYFGGGLALQFGDQTIVQVSPIMAYKVTEKFHAGVGATYIYYDYKQYYYDNNGILQSYKYTSSVYGGSLFGKYFVFNELFLYGEYGILNLEVYDPFSYIAKRQNIHSMLVGGGYLQMVGRSVGMEILVLYDVIDDVNSPYSNPVIRFGVVAGF
ncbi:MAG: hypothetical protein ABIS37_16055 [Bacteroidia bacterium]